MRGVDGAASRLGYKRHCQGLAIGTRHATVCAVAATAGAPATVLKRNRLGSSDLLVPEVCLGTMTYGKQVAAADAHRQLSFALEAGVCFLDTAEIYPVVPERETAGATSSIIGSWLQQRRRRYDVIIATKVAGRSAGLPWIPANRSEPRGAERNPVLDAAAVRSACEAELRRLKTDYVDLYQLHWPDRYLPSFGSSQYRLEEEHESSGFEELVVAIGELIREGKIRHWGLSNESTYGAVMHCLTADRLGVPRPVSIQNSFSLVHRSFESELAEACSPRHLNLGLLPWSALAGGSLTGKYLGGAFPAGARMTLFTERYARFVSARVQAAVKDYCAIAAEAGVTPAQLAYGFCRSRWFIPSTIIGCTTMAQLKENIEGFGGPGLGPDVLQAIDAVHLRYRNPSLVD